jgi:hypothetical protein
MTPYILNLGTRWRWVVSFMPRLLYPQGKNLRYPLNRRLGALHSRSGRGVEVKNSQPPPGIEPQSFDRPARSQSLYRLSYHALIYLSRCKGKVVPVLNYAPRHEDVLGEWRYNSTHSLTSAVDGDEWSASRLIHLTPRERTPSIHEIGGWVFLHESLSPYCAQLFLTGCMKTNDLGGCFRRVSCIPYVSVCPTDSYPIAWASFRPSQAIRREDVKDSARCHLLGARYHDFFFNFTHALPASVIRHIDSAARHVGMSVLSSSVGTNIWPKWVSILRLTHVGWVGFSSTTHRASSTVFVSFTYIYMFRSRVSSVTVITRLRHGLPGFGSRQGHEFFPLATASGPPVLLWNGYRVLFPRE